MGKYKINIIYDEKGKDINDIIVYVLKKEILNLINNVLGKEDII